MHAPVPPPHGPPPTRSSSTRYTPRHPSAATSGGAPSAGSATLLRLAPSPRPPTLSRPPSSSLPQPSSHPTGTTTMLATQQAQASSLPYAHAMQPPPPPRDDDSPSVHSDAASSSHASSSASAANANASSSTVATSAAMARSKVQNILAQLQMHQDSSNAPSTTTSMSSLPRPTHSGTLPRASMIPTAPDRSTPTPSKAIPSASARGASPPRYTRPSLLYGTSPGRAAATVAAQHEPVVAAASASSPSANVLATSPASRRLRSLNRQPSMTGLSSGYGLRSAAGTSNTSVSSSTGLALPPAVAPAAADGYSSSAAQRAAADLDQLAADLGLTSLDAATTTTTSTARHPRSTPSTSRPPTRTTHASADPAAAADPLLAPASSKQAHRLSMAFARLAHSTLSTPPSVALLEAPEGAQVDAATAKNTAANAGGNQSILLLSNDEFAKRLEADWAVPPTPSAATTSFAVAAAGRASAGPPPSSPTPTQHGRTAIPPPSRGASNDALPPPRRAPPSPSPAVPAKAADRPPSTSRAAHLRLSLGVTHGGTSRSDAALASPMRGSFMDSERSHPRTSLIPPPVDVHAANSGTARAKSPRREPLSARLKSPVMPTPPTGSATGTTRSTLPRSSAAASSTSSTASAANGSPPGTLLARRRSTRQAPSLSSTGTTSRSTSSGGSGADTGTISRRGMAPPDTSGSTNSPARSSRIPTLAGAAAAAVAATSAFGGTAKTAASGGSPARTSTTTTGTSRLTALASNSAQAPSSPSSSGSTRPTSSGPSARPTSQSASRTMRATTPRRTTDSAGTGRSTSASTAKTPPPAKRPTSAARSSAPASVSLPFAGKRHTLRAVATAGGAASPWTLAQSGSSGSGGAAVATHRRRKSLTGVPTLAPANATGAVARPNARARTARTNDFRKSMVRRTRDSALSKLTLALVDTYRRVNPAFAYTPRHNPRRVLTKPAKPVRNDGYDNEDNDYILYVNDVLGDDPARSYVIVDLLGQGTFGQVVKCHHVQTQEVSAVKVIKNKPAYFNQSLMEVNVLEVLNKQFDADDTRHIIRLRDSFVYRRHLCLVFEPLSINLYELIKQNQFRGLSLKLVRTFTAQILDALACLADAKLIHADLKPENVLLKSATGTDLKVIDFGSACQEHQTVYTYIQSRFYRSPEVLLGLPYNTAIDMWSTGCIAAELFLGLPLFPGTSEYNQVSRIVDMLGMPPTYMLEVGKNAKTFFQKLSDAPNTKYRLKPRDQYARERNTTEQPSKRYFAGTTLRDVVMQYPVSRKLQGADLDHEMNMRECLVDFLLGMLCFNPMERWSAHQAKMHPFITGAPFTGPWSPTAAVNVKTANAAAAGPRTPRVGSVPATSNSPVASTASPAASAHTVATPAPESADPVPTHHVGGSPTSLRMGRRRAKTISAGAPAPNLGTATAVAGAVDAAALTTQLMHLAVAAGDAPAHARMRRASGIDGAQLAAAAAGPPAAVANQPVGRIHVVGAPQQQQDARTSAAMTQDLPTWNPAYRMIPSHLGLYSTLSGGADDEFDEVDEFLDDADDDARAASAAARSRRPSHAAPRRASVKSTGMAPAAEADALAMWAAAAAPAIEGGSEVSANGTGVDLEWMQELLQNAHVRQRTTTGRQSAAGGAE